MQAFIYNGLPSRVIFGFGTSAQVADELARLGCSRALVLSTPEQEHAARKLAASLGGQAVGVFAMATMHTPVSVTEGALEKALALRADCTIALGGGSTTGLGKAIALRTDLPQIVIPTTYAGSEMTPILGETDAGEKTTLRSPKVLPEVVVYDVDLTLSLPPKLSATSGLNAMAHAVEALYAQDANPIVSLMAEECIRTLGLSLPALMSSPDDKEARSDALYGAWLGGSCLGLVGMALHHKLCHVLGGTFELSHAETHAVVLPYAFAYNAGAVPDAAKRVARALAVKDAVGGLLELTQSLDIPHSLRELGMPQTGIDRAADLAMKNPYWNPRQIERDALRELIGRAWAGAPPVG
jgi:alcohol dehydrogenase class IV